MFFRPGDHVIYKRWLGEYADRYGSTVLCARGGVVAKPGNRCLSPFSWVTPAAPVASRGTVPNGPSHHVGVTPVGATYSVSVRQPMIMFKGSNSRAKKLTEKEI